VKILLPILTLFSALVSTGQTPGAIEAAPLDVQKIVEAVPAAPIKSADELSLAAEAGVKPAAGFDQIRRQAFQLLGEGRTKESLPLFEQALKEKPGDKAARLGYGSALIEQRRYAESAKLYEELLAEYPSDYPIINNLAWLHATAAPGDYHVWSTLAEAYYVQGEYEKAEKTAKEAVALAGRFNASEKLRLEYVQQVDRCRRAAQALRILE
jgi:tetratricopeptide (TPR) repeat protein